MFQNTQVEDNFPTIEEVNFKKIDKRYLKVLLANYLIVLVILYVAIYFLIEKGLNEVIPQFTYIIYIVFNLILFMVLCLIIIGFNRRKYVVREKDLSYKSGVLIHELTTVPFNRIQHIEIHEGPLSRMFNLSSLIIYTAGDSGSDLTIKGLPKEEAKKIKEYITSFINE